jgi:succinate dehydrogenase / fumarate reductase membrane anchor subunit
MNEGTRHFIHQRVTAVLLALLGGWFVISLLQIESMTYLDVTRFIARPVNAALLALLSLSLSYHSHLGVQVVIDDYVHAHGLNRVSLIASRIAHIAVAFAALYAIWQIGSDV